MMVEKKKQLECLKQLTILYVEDDEIIRNEVARFLSGHVGKLLVASDGKEGLDAFRSQRPDIVLSDIHMPTMDGLAMVEGIRKFHKDTPIILTTVFDDTRYLQRAISLGVNGYTLKPISLEELMNTVLRGVEALMQARELMNSRAQLAAYHEASEEERKLVADLMQRMMRPEKLRDSQVRYWLRPSELIGGDLIAVARPGNKKLYVMVADSTGHGLPAALNLLPINHIFYRMVSKNLPVSLIVEEMNWAIRDQSPTDRYVAALVACIDTHNHLVEVWNGGLPGAFYLDENGVVSRVFDSANLPLGILDRTFVAQTEVYQWSDPGDLVVYSDGLSDAENEAGEEFGRQRLIDVLKQAARGKRCDDLIEAVQAHLGRRNAFDDMTLLLAASAPVAAHEMG